jgi:hypothetical protein
MRFLNYLLEFEVIKGSAGRTINASPGIVWLYITKPIYGLLWADKKGNIYKDDQQITSVSPWDSRKDTHKKLVAVAYPKDEKLHLSKNLRDDVDTIVDGYDTDNPRGRIVGDKVYVWNFSGSTSFSKKVNSAIDSIYRYVE